MTSREMQIAFDMLIQQADPSYEIENKPDSYTVFYFINQAQERLVKTRYSGLNPKNEGFEQTQKRVDDLRTLIVETSILTSASSNKPNSYLAGLPSNLFVTVGEEANIVVDSVTKRVEVYPITSDEYTKEVNSPYGKHVLHYGTATPLSLTSDNSVELIGDGNYTIPTYYLRYIKVPSEIGLGGAAECELPEHMHSEIVNEAVTLFLAHQAKEAYQPVKLETSVQE